jgi:hypothetical protein
MSIWIAIALVAGVIGGMIPVIKHRSTRVTGLHIDH